jgi:hypothetical protein
MLKEFELIEATNVYCNNYPSEGGDDKKQLVDVAKDFTKDEIKSTIDFVGSTNYAGDEKIKTTLQKLYTARKK